MAENRKRQSPYQRYDKVPYRYSEELQNWRAAVRRGDANAMRHWAQKHNQKFGMFQQPPQRSRAFYEALDAA